MGKKGDGSGINKTIWLGREGGNKGKARHLIVDEREGRTLERKNHAEGYMWSTKKTAGAIIERVRSERMSGSRLAESGGKVTYVVKNEGHTNSLRQIKDQEGEDMGKCCWTGRRCRWETHKIRRMLRSMQARTIASRRERGVITTTGARSVRTYTRSKAATSVKKKEKRDAGTISARNSKRKEGNGKNYDAWPAKKKTTQVS